MVGPLLARLRRAPLPSSLRLFWVLIVLWLELGSYYWSTLDCRWPDEKLDGTVPTHVLLVADPQVLDENSYPDRGPALMALSQFIVDLQLRKAWHTALATRPDAVVFLGDMLDNGRAERGNKEYRQYVEKFNRMFADTRGKKLPRYYIPGNHDVWLGGDDPLSKLARTRYQTYFGPLNSHASLGGHTLLFIDAPYLVEEDAAQRRAGVDGDISHWLPEALQELHATMKMASRSGEQPDPVVLFSHIPLWRTTGTDCGPDRERGTLKEGRGFGYENTLSPTISRMLLDTFKPVAIFSGDDHDYCEITHSATASGDSTGKSVTEISVKSLSMAMGIQRPGFSLLSLSSGGAAHTMCLLPSQLGLYLRGYLPVFLLTVVVLFVHASRRGSSGRSGFPKSYAMTGLPYSRSEPGLDYDRRRSGAIRRDLVPHWVQRKTQSLERSFLGRFMVDIATVAWLPLSIFVVLVIAVSW
ncbi:Metallo-dependent phosphatase [Peniophora sp. CONT]|nr:Metallo-dependent phosphatase [Peniophora sp. CONT]